MSEPVILNQSDIDLLPADIRSLIDSVQVDQGTEEWLEERLGKVTASNVKEVVIRNKYGKPYQGYYDYMLELAIERITGKGKRFSSRYTNHGNTFEAAAAQMYQEQYPDRDIRECGFTEHPKLAAGASLDRTVDNDGTLEIKAPNSDTLIKYMISMLPVEDENYDLVKMLGLKGEEWLYYYEQIQMQLWIAKRKWCDFCVYDPDLAEDGQLIVKRIVRNNQYINGEMKPRVIEFLNKVDRLEHYLRERLGFVVL